jgi:hypothetical protein
MVTPVVCPRRHQRLLPVGWPVDGASCQASANYAREYHLPVIVFSGYSIFRFC